jgi:hypothetical protein
VACPFSSKMVGMPKSQFIGGEAYEKKSVTYFDELVNFGIPTSGDNFEKYVICTAFLYLFFLVFQFFHIFLTL